MDKVSKVKVGKIPQSSFLAHYIQSKYRYDILSTFYMDNPRPHSHSYTIVYVRMTGANIMGRGTLYLLYSVV